jgi:phosphinothricin acetyltransferase
VVIPPLTIASDSATIERGLTDCRPMIRTASPADAQGICTIYNHYVANTIITFEEEPISIDEMAGRIEEVTHGLPWYLYEESGRVVGYAYAIPWKSRSAYRYSVESAVYVSSDCLGNGVGSKLYRALITELKGRSLHCVIGGIALPNAASIALHEKMGFEKVAQFREVGWKFQRRIDVGYWELLL